MFYEHSRVEIETKSRSPFPIFQRRLCVAPFLRLHCRRWQKLETANFHRTIRSGRWRAESTDNKKTLQNFKQSWKKNVTKLQAIRLDNLKQFVWITFRFLENADAWTLSAWLFCCKSSLFLKRKLKTKRTNLKWNQLFSPQAIHSTSTVVDVGQQKENSRRSSRPATHSARNCHPAFPFFSQAELFSGPFVYTLMYAVSCRVVRYNQNAAPPVAPAMSNSENATTTHSPVSKKLREVKQNCVIVFFYIEIYKIQNACFSNCVR